MCHASELSKNFSSKTATTIYSSPEEIGENPLFASLVVKATEPQYYKVNRYSGTNASFKEEISGINTP